MPTDMMEQEIQDAAKQSALANVATIPDRQAPQRPLAPMPTVAKLGTKGPEFVHWTMAINLVLDNLQRQGKARFADKDSETMLNVKSWLDHQST
jgi:hypothetical protein